MTQTEIFGLVLAGGHSSRMGRDKSLIDAYHGKPQREYVFEILQQHCAHVFTSYKDAATIPPNLNPIADAYEIESPLNGILSAFLHHPSKAWLTVPVDMPAITAETIQYLIERRDVTALATCFLDSDGKSPEPLFTIWEPAAYPSLKNFYASAQISARDFLKSVKTNLLIAPDKKILSNINSPDQLDDFIRSA